MTGTDNRCQTREDEDRGSIMTLARAARRAVPAAIRSRATLGRIDYESAFTVATDPCDHRSAEQWARAMYESPPTAQRVFIWYSWKALTARLGPYPSDKHILGYRIKTNDRDYICFSVTWTLGLTCDLVLAVAPETATLGSFVELNRPAARIVWPMVALLHERIVPYWLTRAARSGRTSSRAR